MGSDSIRRKSCRWTHPHHGWHRIQLDIRGCRTDRRGSRSRRRLCLVGDSVLQPTDAEGMFQHFSAVAGAINLPIILYNVPSRTGCDLANDTILRLSQIENIVGLKDATGDVDRGAVLIHPARGLPFTRATTALPAICLRLVRRDVFRSRQCGARRNG